jgi:hypothetical protein
MAGEAIVDRPLHPASASCSKAARIERAVQMRGQLRCNRVPVWRRLVAHVAGAKSTPGWRPERPNGWLRGVERFATFSGCTG